MLVKLKSIFNSDDKKRLLSNFLSLSILQGTNYILPLITLPYLVRVLGPEKFGLIAFAQAFIAYFNMLTDYGFNLSATREISIYRNNKRKVSEIFSSVMIIKLGLSIISFIIITVIIFSFDKFKKDWFIYYFSFGIVIGQVLFPVWFFQGMERMKYITLLNITAKLIFTISIFIFIKRMSDYIYVPLLNSLGYLTAGILAVWIILKNFKLKVVVPNLNNIKHQLRAGWHIFISTVGINMYKSNSIFILGIFANNVIVGYFSVAKKIMDIINSLAGVISQSIYPYTMRRISQYSITPFLKKIGFGIALYTFFIGLVLFFFANIITKLIAGNNFYPMVVSIKMLAFVPLVIGINVPAVHMLLGKKKDKLFTKAVFLGAILDLILNFLLVPHYSYIGSCISIIITEAFVTIMLYWYCTL